MSESPHLGLPKQSGGWADLKAAYRLLDNDRVDPERVGEVHRQQTRGATADHTLVLLVQDDTDLQAVKLPGGRQMQHSTLAVLPDGRLLGVMQQAWFARTIPPEGETREQRMRRWRESRVWSDAAEAIGPAPPGCRYVHVADRASDDLTFMAACEAQGHGFLIRARHDRRVDEATAKLWPRLQEQPALGEMRVTVGTQRDQAGRVVRRGREATVELSSAELRLEPPWNHPGDHEPRWVRAVYLRESEPPADAEAIDWMLLSSEPVTGFEDARRLVEHYQRRWVIEEWHRALKEGCRLEASQLGSIENLRRLAALNSVVAVRLMQLRDLADPDRLDDTADAPEALQRSCPWLWIRVVAALAGTDPQKLTPRRFYQTIARRGGHIGRKRDGRPGWKVLWRGWYDIQQMARGAELMQRSPPSSGCG